MLPSTFNDLSKREKAFVIASLDLMIEAEQKQIKEIERQTKGK